MRGQSYVAAASVVVNVAKTRDLELKCARDFLGVGEDGVDIVVTHPEILFLVVLDSVRFEVARISS